jgi:hypothetical protein
VRAVREDHLHLQLQHLVNAVAVQAIGPIAQTGSF